MHNRCPAALVLLLATACNTLLYDPHEDTTEFTTTITITTTDSFGVAGSLSPTSSGLDSTSTTEGTDADSGVDSTSDSSGTTDPSTTTGSSTGNSETGDDSTSGGETPQQFVFVTKDTWAGNLGGIEGADTKCQKAAVAVPLPRSQSSKYRAWLSIGFFAWPPFQIDAWERFPQSTAAYVLVNGAPVASGLLGLKNGNLESAINVTEEAKILAIEDPAPVWTNSTPSGSNAGTDDCELWSFGFKKLSGRIGDARVKTSAWTNMGIWPCNSPAHLYCIEINCSLLENKVLCKP